MKKLLAVSLAVVLISGIGFAAPTYGIYREEGVASWYGAEFAGRATASGEMFDPGKLTCAHPTLPFGTMLQVTNQTNNKTVTVRVNDRGPFVSARIIDLSQAAAQALGMVQTGTAPVLVESVNPVALGNNGDNTVLSNPAVTPVSTSTGGIPGKSSSASPTNPILPVPANYTPSAPVSATPAPAAPAPAVYTPFPEARTSAVSGTASTTPISQPQASPTYQALPSPVTQMRSQNQAIPEPISTSTAPSPLAPAVQPKPVNAAAPIATPTSSQTGTAETPSGQTIPTIRLMITTAPSVTATVGSSANPAAASAPVSASAAPAPTETVANAAPSAPAATPSPVPAGSAAPVPAVQLAPPLNPAPASVASAPDAAPVEDVPEAPLASVAVAKAPAKTEKVTPPPSADVSASGKAARLVGSTPDKDPSKTYRVQVGSYLLPQNAVGAIDACKAQGLNPAYERSGDYYRVVISGIKAGQLPEIASKLGAAGYSEALVREEN